MNKVILIGRLTRDPELTSVGDGVEVCKFSIAVDRQFKSQSGEKQTDFFNIVVWRQQGVNCQKYLKKGSQCAVFGRIENRSYDDKDGNKRYVTDIIADNVEFLGGKSDGGGGNYNEFNQDAAPASNKKVSIDTLEPIDDENLPF
jgi:single-strand DNA-binding protein